MNSSRQEVESVAESGGSLRSRELGGFVNELLLRLPFKQKGILLVALPLFFEILFVGLLSLSYLKAEAESRRADHGRRVLTITDAMTSSIFAIGASLFVNPGANPEIFESRFITLEQNLQALMSDLVQETKTYPREGKLAKVIESAMLSLQSQANEMRKLANDPIQQMARTSFRKSRLTAKKSLHSLAESIDTLISYESSVSGARLRRAQQARQQLNLLLYAGVAANVGVSLWIALLFATQVTNRLAIVSRNAISMSKKQYPSESLGGKDELAELDKLIHHLSDLLIESSRRELALVDNTFEVILSLTEDLKVSAVNAAATKQWGWDQELLKLTGVTELLLAEHRQIFVRSINAVRNVAGSQNFECSMLRSDGSIMEVRWSVLWSEREQSYFAIVRDVGEERRMEKMRKHFFAMITHDLRSPLANMKLFLHMLRNGAYGTLTPMGANRIDKLDDSVDFLTKLTNDILELSRMQTQNFVLKKELFKPVSLIEDCCFMLESLFENRSIKLSIQAADDEEICADFLRLKQVLANFLSNASKFSPEGATVTISVNKHGDCRRIAVKDGGHNLSEVECKRIFEPYVQAENQSEVQIKGFGLGLSVAKTIIESHFGSIGAYVDGDGTSFWFEIPESTMEHEIVSSD